MIRIAAILLFCCGFVGHAHSTSLFAEYHGNLLKGRAYSGAHGISGATVYISTVDHKALGNVQTDDNGNFEIKLESRIPVECVLKLSDGHGARYVVSIDEDHQTAQDHHSPGNSASIEELHEELDQLKQLIHEQAHHNGIRDIVGGIGYILGIAGIVVLLKNKKPA